MAQKIDEPDDSIVMLKKLDNNNEGDFNVLDLTHLSESEQLNNGSNKLTIVDEFKEGTQNITRRSNRKKSTAVSETERVRNSRSSSDSITSMSKQLLVVVDRMDMNSLKSISTVGRSPITAHGDIDESPPYIKDIDRTITRRSIETEGYSDGVVDFYDDLTNNLHIAAHNSTRNSEINNPKIQSNLKTMPKRDTKTMIDTSPFTSITRLSQNEIDKYLIPSRNLNFDSSSPSKSEVSVDNPKERPNVQNTQSVRKSVISPISIDDAMFDTKPLTPVEEQTKTSEPEESQSNSKRYNLRKVVKTLSTKGNNISMNDSQTVLSQSDDPANNSIATKKQKIDSENTSTSYDVKPSGSSVDSWLCRNDGYTQSSRAEAPTNDVLSSVLEKTDTTLHEIHAQFDGKNAGGNPVTDIKKVRGARGSDQTDRQRLAVDAVALEHGIKKARRKFHV